MIHETLIYKLNKNTDCNYGKSVLPWEAKGAFILVTTSDCNHGKCLLIN